MRPSTSATFSTPARVSDCARRIPVAQAFSVRSLRAELNTPAYYALTGMVNSDIFEGYQPGEVLFMGASGQKRGDAEDGDLVGEDILPEGDRGERIFPQPFEDPPVG